MKKKVTPFTICSLKNSGGWMGVVESVSWQSHVVSLILTDRGLQVSTHC